MSLTLKQKGEKKIVSTREQKKQDHYLSIRDLKIESLSDPKNTVSIYFNKDLICQLPLNGL